MLIAQALGEYGGLSGLAGTLGSLIYGAEETIECLGAKEWTAIGVVVVAALVFFGRRRR